MLYRIMEKIPGVTHAFQGNGIPFFPASSPRTGVVETGGGPLNVRVRPDPDSPVIARLYDGARVTVVNAWEGWDLVRFGEEAGYAAAAFIR